MKNHTILNFRTIKIEFNQRKLLHHTSIDAILLAGYQPKTSLHQTMIEKGIINIDATDSIESTNEEPITKSIDNIDERDLFSELPVSFSIFYNDKSLIVS